MAMVKPLEGNPGWIILPELKETHVNARFGGM